MRGTICCDTRYAGIFLWARNDGFCQENGRNLLIGEKISSLKKRCMSMHFMTVGTMKEVNREGVTHRENHPPLKVGVLLLALLTPVHVVALVDDLLVAAFRGASLQDGRSLTDNYRQLLNSNTP